MFEGLKFKVLRVKPDRNLSEEGRELSALVELVKDCLNKAVFSFKINCFKAGFLLKKIKENRLYCLALRGSYSEFTYDDRFLTEPFVRFCKDQFGLSKSTAYSLIHVAEKFGDDVSFLPLSEYASFNYSQLLEMSSLSDEELLHVSSDMTVAQIKALKKKKEKKSSVPSEEPKPLIEVVDPYVFKDLKTARDDFKVMVKRLFENKGYKIMFKSSFIGGQAFGVELFDYLVKRGFFDANKNT